MIGLLGGAFDPVHNGHLRLALELLGALSLEEVRFIPTQTPPHRDEPSATPAHRLAMLKVAVEGLDRVNVDDREMRRDGPSYTIDTLNSLREEYPKHPLCLILGVDAFRFFDSWHRWREIPERAHIAVARRPGAVLPADGEPVKLLKEREVHDPAALHEQPAGLLMQLDLPPLDISATRIRRLLRAGHNPRFLLPDAVLEQIHKRGVYIA